VTLFFLIGLVLTGGCGVLVLRAVTLPRARRRETLAQIGAYGFHGVAPGPTIQSRSLREILDGLAVTAGRASSRRLQATRERELRKLLHSAGFYRMTVTKFLGYRVLAAVCGPLAALLLSLPGGIGVRSVLAAAALGAMGWFVPMYILKRRSRIRLELVDREVPELVDLLVTTVEAGVGFAVALQLAARNIQGPLGEELRLALQEQNMGLTTEQALRNVAARVDSPAMRAFIQSLLQGESLGVSIGKVLRDLAGDMRTRRRQSAEERAQKAPTKILFPLIVLILPALFIVALGPVMMSLLRMFSSS
jgi:tight adherence protein C